MLSRSIKKIYSTDNINKQDNLTFADILAIPNIVLLGEPGAGKTHLFKIASAYEQGNCIAAGDFTVYADESYSDKALYIDALDEMRSRTDQHNSIKAIIGSIKKVKPSKVRISCRATDWLGETDLKSFKPYFDATGGYCVVVLDVLNEAEIDQILTDRHVVNPNEFKEKANEKGVSSLLNNPQTLIMLIDSVTAQNGQWPKSKNELYDIATRLLLEEHDDSHLRKPLAAYTATELKNAAGAASAVLLIADVKGICLVKGRSHSYAEIPYQNENKEAVLAALTKRAFVTSNQQQEQVTYSHRTIAEYLAACWLVDTIRNGLPISRVCSLLCVDGHPAPELRGLYAWLTQLLPEYADILLATDPYGVLVQGDVACLSLSSRKALLNALVKLAENDPWFRGEDWTSEPLGALSTPEIAVEFKALLAKEPKQFHLRSLVLDAIRYGEPQPTLQNELMHILCDNNQNYSERFRAYAGLIHAIPNGKELVVTAVRKQLQNSSDDLRLKETILASMFAGYFTVHDVVQFINDYVNHQKEDNNIGGLYLLNSGLPVNVLPELLDSISQIDSQEYATTDQLWYFNYECLTRVLLEEEPIEIAKLWLWLSRIKYSTSGFYRNEDAIKDWFIANPNCVIEMFKIALLERGDLNIFGFWNNFQQLVRFAFDIEQIIDTAFVLISDKRQCDEQDQFIFALVLELVLRKDTTTDISKFNLLLEYSQSHPELAELVTRSCQSYVPDWRLEEAKTSILREEKQAATQHKNRTDFEESMDVIRHGQHLGWLEWLANVYFARFSDVNNKQTPQQRLEQQLGKQNLAVALEGLRSALNRADLPTPLKIAQLYTQNKYQPWWYSILAGMSENWLYQKNLNSYPEPALKSALAFNLLFPSFFHVEGNSNRQFDPAWQHALFQDKPELVQAVYLEVIETLLTTKRDYVQGIRDICQHPQLAINRPAIILRLLTDYPNAPIQELKTMLLTAIFLPEIAKELLLLIEKNLQLRTKVRLHQKALWLCAGFLMDFEQFKDRVRCSVNRRIDFGLMLIAFLGQRHPHSNKAYSEDLSPAHLGFLIHLVGKIKHPMGSHNLEAADFINPYIKQLSARTDKESIAILKCLINNSELESYHDYLKHALANQAALCRKQHFDRPNWQQAIESLKNGKPAHTADLHALTIEHLKDVANRMANENTDMFKFFWNEDSYGRITQPKPEESCRDKLIEWLRPKFAPFGISVEPEGHMARDKRADIVLKYQTEQTLPIEVKRGYHADLWTACETQLDRLYTRDPQTKGYGIYLVFWFGDNRKRSMPNPPKGIQKPKTAQELEITLRSLIKPEAKNKLAVVVLDVSD